MVKGEEEWEAHNNTLHTGSREIHRPITIIKDIFNTAEARLVLHIEARMTRIHIHIHPLQSTIINLEEEGDLSTVEEVGLIHPLEVPHR